MSHNSDTSQTSSVELQTTIEKLESEKKRLMKNINELESENTIGKERFKEAMKDIEELK